MEKTKDFRKLLYCDFFLLFMLFVVNFWRYNARFVFDAPFLTALAVMLGGLLCNVLIFGLTPGLVRPETEKKEPLYVRFNRKLPGAIAIFVDSLVLCAWGWYAAASDPGKFFSWRMLAVVALWLVVTLLYIWYLYRFKWNRVER